MMYDIIVLENLRLFSSSTHKREAGAIENLHAGERLWKDAFSVILFTGYVWAVGQTGEKN